MYSANKTAYHVVFVLGGPGCGKGTQCAKISETFHYVHLSAGDLLRIEQKDPNSKLGAEIAQHMVNGTIVPAEVTCALLEKAMAENVHANKGCHFLIDGFPRNENNLQGWEKTVGTKAKVEFVLYFSCPDDICVARCQERGKASGRMDDNEETLKRRLLQFKSQCQPIIEHFRKQNLVREIDATGSPEEVFAEVTKLFQK